MRTGRNRQNEIDIGHMCVLATTAEQSDGITVGGNVILPSPVPLPLPRPSSEAPLTNTEEAKQPISKHRKTFEKYIHLYM